MQRPRTQSFRDPVTKGWRFSCLVNWAVVYSRDLAVNVAVGGDPRVVGDIGGAIMRVRMWSAASNRFLKPGDFFLLLCAVHLPFRIGCCLLLGLTRTLWICAGEQRKKRRGAFFALCACWVGVF